MIITATTTMPKIRGYNTKKNSDKICYKTYY